MKKDCPHRQKDGGAQKNPKVSKVKTSSKEKESPEKTKGEPVVEKSEEPTPNPTPLRTSTSVAEDVKSDGYTKSYTFEDVYIGGGGCQVGWRKWEASI
eukprot:s2459_g23.t1